jgi:hypothetical protein
VTPQETTSICQNLERIANALERRNDLTARQADMSFLQLTTNDQSRVELMDKRRLEEKLRLRDLASRPADTVAES